MRSRIIGLAGYAGSGKDEVGKLLVRQGYEKLAFADRVKELTLALDPICAFMPSSPFLLKRPWLRFVTPMRFYRLWTLSDLIAAFGAEDAKRCFPEVRRVYQKLGTDVCRSLNPDVWVDELVKKIDHETSYVITDVRFPNEVEAIHALGGEVWWVNREGHGPLNGHVSESSIDLADMDWIVDNNGSLGDLSNTVMDLAHT